MEHKGIIWISSNGLDFKPLQEKLIKNQHGETIEFTDWWPFVKEVMFTHKEGTTSPKHLTPRRVSATSLIKNFHPIIEACLTMSKPITESLISLTSKKGNYDNFFNIIFLIIWFHLSKYFICKYSLILFWFNNLTSRRIKSYIIIFFT